MGIIKKINSAFTIWQRGGYRAVADQFALLKHNRQQRESEDAWFQKNGSLTTAELDYIHSQIAGFVTEPLISIILPVYSRDDIWIRKCIDSVIGQLYQNWELCIGEDLSPNALVRSLLREYASRESRIKINFRETNGNISAASNSALNLATGVFSVLLDHDDELTEDALFWIAREINLHPDAGLIYTDSSMLDAEGDRYSPAFKPDWSPDLFHSMNMLNHISSYKTEVIKKVGGFRLGAEGSQDYDLALRVIEQIEPEQIRHIPRVLYLWRAVEGSVAFSSDEKPYAYERARDAIRLHFERCGISATVEPTTSNYHRVRYLLPNPPPQIEVIALTTENNSAERLNAAVKASNAEVICFLQTGLKPQNESWLTELVGFAIQPGIGAVGGKILDSKGKVIDGGIVIGAGGLTAVAHEGFPKSFPGNMHRNQVIGNYSAVSLSCMAIRREVFEEIGGFDEENLPNTLFGVDLCLRLRESGYRIVFTPYIEMIRNRAALQKVQTADEEMYFRKRWNSYVENDPFYNSNLSKKDATFSI